MKWPFLIFASIAGLVTAGAVTAGPKETRRIETAIDVLNDAAAIPDKTIPHYLLQKASGIAVIPGVLKGALGIGARWGKGVLVVRTPDGSWSDPCFISLTGGSIGWQIGGESTDFVLIFRTRSSVEAINNGKFTLGGDVSVAAGPVGRNAEASTDVQLKADILSYARGRGLFAGASIEGSVLGIDDDANADFYKVKDISARRILAGNMKNTPPQVAQFQKTVRKVSQRTPAKDTSKQR